MAQLMDAVEKREIKYLDNVNMISQQTKDLMNKMLVKDPQKRISWKELFERELNGVPLASIRQDPQ